MSASTDEGFFATPPAELPAGSRGRLCPACGVINDRHRELCRTCGADLETGHELPHLTERDAGNVPPPQPRARPRRRWWLPVVTVLVAALVALGGLMLAGVGPFGASGDVDVPPASFDPARYPGDPQVIALSDIATVTSQPPADGQSFDPLHMVDDDPSTTWMSDGAQRPDDLPETIELVPELAVWLSSIVVRNGDQRDLDAYEASSRLREVAVSVDGGVVLRVVLLDEGLTAQRVDLDEPVLTTAVRIEVIDRYQGDGPDVAVSDLDLLGWQADADDTALAILRAQRLPAGANGRAAPSQVQPS